MGTPTDSVPYGYKVVYTPRIWHRFAHRWIYPKNGKVFRLVVKDRDLQR